MEKLITCKFLKYSQHFLKEGTFLRTQILALDFLSLHPALQGSSFALTDSALASVLDLPRSLSQTLTSPPCSNPYHQLPAGHFFKMSRCQLKLNICTMNGTHLLPSSPLCSDRQPLHSPQFFLSLSQSLPHLSLSLTQQFQQ